MLALPFAPSTSAVAAVPDVADVAAAGPAPGVPAAAPAPGVSAGSHGPGVSSVPVTVSAPVGRAMVVVPFPASMQVLAASHVGIVSLVDGVPRVFDQLGRPVRTIPPPSHTHERGQARAVGLSGPSAPLVLPGTTADSGWVVPYDPDDVDYRDDPRLADEVGATRRSRSQDRSKSAPASAPVRGLVVAGGGYAWMVRADGLWRIDLENGAAARALASTGNGMRAVAVSPDGGTVAAVNATELLRSRDGGTTFDVLGSIPTAPAAVAATRTGNLFIVDHYGVRMVRSDRIEMERVELPGARDVAPCADEAIVLANGAVYTISDASISLPVRPIATAPPGADRIACPPAGSPWFAWGFGLWTSNDRGRSWTPRSDLPSVPILDVAVTSFTVWIATTSGLVGLPIAGSTTTLDQSAGHRHSSSPTSAPPPPQGFADATSLPLPRQWWRTALPRIDVSVTSSHATSTSGQTTARREFCAWIVATFTLDRRQPIPHPSDDARENSQRRAVREQTRALLAATPFVPNDPLADEERRELARILEEKP